MVSMDYTPEGRLVTRVQIRLTEDQDRQLERLARRLGKSKTSLVSDGVDFVLQRSAAPTRDALLDLVGQAGRAGRRAIAARHDVYLTGRGPPRSR